MNAKHTTIEMLKRGQRLKKTVELLAILLDYQRALLFTQLYKSQIFYTYIWLLSPPLLSISSRESPVKLLSSTGAVGIRMK